MISANEQLADLVHLDSRMSPPHERRSDTNKSAQELTQRDRGSMPRVFGFEISDELTTELRPPNGDISVNFAKAAAGTFPSLLPFPRLGIFYVHSQRHMRPTSVHVFHPYAKV